MSSCTQALSSSTHLTYIPLLLSPGFLVARCRPTHMCLCPSPCVICKHMYLEIHVYTHTYMHTYIHIYNIHIYIVYMYICIHICLCSPRPTTRKNAHFAHLSITLIRQRLRTSKNPTIQTSKNPKVQKSNNSKIHLKIQKSKNSKEMQDSVDVKSFVFFYF